jgi:hypothetical protein
MVERAALDVQACHYEALFEKVPGERPAPAGRDDWAARRRRRAGIRLPSRR